MANDVLLEENDHPNILRIEAPTVRIAGHDLMLEVPERRKGDNPWRRALVHNENDGLTVNFDGDYPGGVTLNGVTEITLHRDREDLLAAVLPPSLVIHGDITFEVQGVKLDEPGTVMIPVSLTRELEKLRTEISELAAKVKALGG